jgi:hypothetical protein
MFILVGTELTRPLIYMLLLPIVIEIENLIITIAQLFFFFFFFFIHSCQSP